MRPRKGYNRESLARALAHHEITGVLSFVGPPEPGDPTWRIGFAHGAVERFTPGQAYAICVALAAVEQQGARA